MQWGRSVLIFVAFLLAGCLANNQASQSPSTVQVNLELSNISAANTIVAGDDQIIINRVRLLHGASFFGTGLDSLFLLRNPQRPKVEEFTSQSNNPALLVEGNLIEGTYQLLNIKFPAADSTDANIDPGFRNGGLYSMLIEGSYNGESFTYNSTRSYEKIHNFSPALNVPEFDAAYIFLVSSDVADWFLAEDGGSLLDPANSENSPIIDGNIAASLDISVVQK